MRKTTTCGVLLSMLLTGTAPLIAQKTSGSGVLQSIARDANFDTVRAITDGDGVVITWRMASEEGVVGYNVYRVDVESKAQLNRAIIATGARKSSPGIVNLGEPRNFFDLDGKTEFQYVVEGIRLDGSRFIGRTVPVTTVTSVQAETGVSTENYRLGASADNSIIDNRTSSLTGELADLVAAYAQTPNPQNQFQVASKGGAKIAVKKDGFYRVSAAQLQQAAFPVDTDASKWRLFTNGVEQAIIVAPDRSYIEFYGRSIDTAETDTRIYYLIADTVPGKRIGTKVLRNAPGSPTARNYPVVFERRQRSAYINKLYNGDEEDFVGDPFNSEPGSQFRMNLNLTGIDFSQPTVQVTIRLLGWNEFGSHRVTPTINGHALAPMEQFGIVDYDKSYTLPTEFFFEGDNEFELTGATPPDWNYFNNIKISYKRKFLADAGKVSFSTPGSKTVNLEGFSTPSVRVFDTTFEGEPVLVKNLTAEEVPGAGYRVRVPSSRMMVGYAVEDIALLQSPSVTKNAPSTLSATTNAADMLIISHSDPAFLNAAGNWAAYRRSAAGGNLTTAVIDVADVYDEFGYGLPRADSVRAFLQHAATRWASSPKYVLLIGDGHENPRNYTLAEGAPGGFFNMIPSRGIRYIDYESFSDELLGDWDGDDVSAIPIGRIPARNAAEIAIAFNKMVKFETNQTSLSRGILFAHGFPRGYDFQATNQHLAQLLPQGTQVDIAAWDDPNATANLVTKMNRGPVVVNYAGHGAISFWADSSLLPISEVTNLTNRDYPSIVTQLTCMTGMFTNARQTLSESLLFAENGGAAATWASMGSTTADIQEVMGKRFFEQLVGTSAVRIGDAIKVAKAATPSGRDVKLSWSLLGDPAMRIP